MGKISKQVLFMKITDMIKLTKKDMFFLEI